MDHVDNLDQFRTYIKERLTEPGDFFPVLFMTRAKDGHDKTQLLDFKYIYSLDNFNRQIENIKSTCISKNARCYIKINKRNDEDISRELVRYTLDKHLKKEYHMMSGAYHHIIGVTQTKGPKLYLIDLDDTSLLDQVLAELQKIKEEKHMADGEIITVRTRNGLHLLVPSFDTVLFKKTFKDVTVYKDADSLLYF